MNRCYLFYIKTIFCLFYSLIFNFVGKLLRNIHSSRVRIVLFHVNIMRSQKRKFKVFLIVLFPPFYVKMQWKCRNNLYVVRRNSCRTKSASSLSQTSSSDDDFPRRDLEPGSSDEGITTSKVDSNVWYEIKSESDK